MTDGYDVALSFAGEQRTYVQRVADLLREAGAKVFFDDFEEGELWGEDLAVHFDTVYRTGARYVVPFVSADYAAKAWPQHEFKSALARAVESKEEPYILPVRFDATALPGLRPTIRYLDGTRLSPEEVGTAILQRLGKKGAQESAAQPAARLPKLPPANFNPFAESERALAHFKNELSRRSRDLKGRGFGVHAQDRNGRFMLRVMQAGRTIYGLDVWLGGGWGDNTFSFATGSGDLAAHGGTNATGEVEWDRTRGVPVIKLINFSLLPQIGGEYRLTAEELTDAIWESLVTRLEQAMR